MIIQLILYVHNLSLISVRKIKLKIRTKLSKVIWLKITHNYNKIIKWNKKHLKIKNKIRMS